MNYNNYPHRGNLANLVFDDTYRYDFDYDKECGRFDYSILTDDENDALREWSDFNGPSGDRWDAPNVYMNFYVRSRLEGFSASRIKGDSKDHRKHTHLLCKLLEVHSLPILQSPLYRAMGTIPEALENKFIGDSVILDHIIAVSLNSSVAVAGFGGSNGTVMIIKEAIGIPAYKGEQEFLLAPGSRFVINNIYRVDWNYEHDDLFENLTVFEVSMVANENKLPLLNRKNYWSNILCQI